jgi:hypothetical protein
VSIPPEVIEVGKCYLTHAGKERHVISADEGKVTYHLGGRLARWKQRPQRYVTMRTTFALQVMCAVPCTGCRDCRLVR